MATEFTRDDFRSGRGRIWFDREVRRAEVGYVAAWEEESEENYPAETAVDRIIRAENVRRGLLVTGGG